MSHKHRRDIGAGRAIVRGRSRPGTSAAAAQLGARVSGSVVLFFIFASAAISLYDLSLVIKFLAG